MWVEDSGDSFRQRATHLVWADTRPLCDRVDLQSTCQRSSNENRAMGVVC